MGWEPPTPPKVDLSLLRYRQEFQKNETYKPPKVYDLKKGKEILQSGDFKGRHEGVFYSGGCVIRTTKKGVENSKRTKEEDRGNYGRAHNPRWTESRREKGHKEYSKGRQAESPARKRRRSRSRSRGWTRRADKDKDRHRSETTTAKKRSASRSRSRKADMDKERQHRREHDEVKRERRRSRSRSSGRRF